MIEKEDYEEEIERKIDEIEELNGDVKLNGSIIKEKCDKCGKIFTHSDEMICFLCTECNDVERRNYKKE